MTQFQYCPIGSNLNYKGAVCVKISDSWAVAWSGKFRERKSGKFHSWADGKLYRLWIGKEEECQLIYPLTRMMVWKSCKEEAYHRFTKARETYQIKARKARIESKK